MSRGSSYRRSTSNGQKRKQQSEKNARQARRSASRFQAAVMYSKRTMQERLNRWRERFPRWSPLTRLSSMNVVSNLVMFFRALFTGKASKRVNATSRINGHSPVLEALEPRIVLTSDVTITTPSTFDIDENTIGSAGSTSTNPHAEILTWTITGGDDAGFFNIDSGTGVVSFKSAPDFETKADKNNDGVYNVGIQVNDTQGSDTANLQITVNDVNEGPTIDSVNTFAPDENQFGAANIDASDPDAGSTLTYTITGGADAGKFDINTSNGTITFKSTPDFENPNDAGADGTYNLDVQVSDGVLTDSDSIAITVNDINDAPEITSSKSFNAAENQTKAGTVTATDQDGDTVTFSITGGVDAAEFKIGSKTGALAFKSAPNFEAKASNDADNDYHVTVVASDGKGGSESQNITVTVTDVNDTPTINSPTTFSVNENQTLAADVNAADQDGDTLTYTIDGGIDSAFFDINTADGMVTFKVAPDFEANSDNDGDNDYQLKVKVSDGSKSTTQDIQVTVLDVNDAPNITSASVWTVAENQNSAADVDAVDQDGDMLTYSISGGVDASKFNINSKSGVVTFITTPDKDNPHDDGKDNQYDLTVTVTDGKGGSSVQSLEVNVSDANDLPTITSGASFTVAENQTGAADVDATDQDKGDVLTYTIEDGDDSSFFSIDTATGVITFDSAPDYEAKSDTDKNNVYELDVKVSDGSMIGGSATQSITVTVQDINDVPVINESKFNANENQTAVGTITSSDQDGGTPTYTVEPGIDGAVNTGQKVQR